MAAPTNREVIAQWRDEPAPLLALLQRIPRPRWMYLGGRLFATSAVGLRIPLAELFGTVTFYHHFAREGPGQSAPRVCTGPVCRLQGGLEILEALQAEGRDPDAVCWKVRRLHTRPEKDIRYSLGSKQTLFLYSPPLYPRHIPAMVKNVSSPKFVNPNKVH